MFRASHAIRISTLRSYIPPKLRALRTTQHCKPEDHTLNRCTVLKDFYDIIFEFQSSTLKMEAADVSNILILGRIDLFASQITRQQPLLCNTAVNTPLQR
jgi:hypothetical protein